MNFRLVWLQCLQSNHSEKICCHEREICIAPHLRQGMFSLLTITHCRFQPWAACFCVSCCTFTLGSPLSHMIRVSQLLLRSHSADDCTKLLGKVHRQHPWICFNLRSGRLTSLCRRSAMCLCRRRTWHKISTNPLWKLWKMQRTIEHGSKQTSKFVNIKFALSSC